MRNKTNCSRSQNQSPFYSRLVLLSHAMHIREFSLRLNCANQLRVQSIRSVGTCGPSGRRCKLTDPTTTNTATATTTATKNAALRLCRCHCRYIGDCCRCRQHNTTPTSTTNQRPFQRHNDSNNQQRSSRTRGCKLPNLTSSVFGFICFVVWQRGNERSHQQQQPNDDSLIEFGMYRLWLATFSRG